MSEKAPFLFTPRIGAGEEQGSEAETSPLRRRFFLRAYHQDGAVSMPYNRIGHAAHERPPYPPQPSAAGNDKSRSYLLAQNNDLLVRTPHPKVSPRDCSSCRLYFLYLLLE